MVEDYAQYGDWRVEWVDGPLWTVTLSKWGRVRDAARRSALFGVGAFVTLSILLLPDYLGRYRDQEPFPGMFWLIMASIGLLVGGVVGGLRLLRRETWLVDPGAETLVFHRRSFWGKATEEIIELNDVDRIGCARDDGGVMRLYAVLGDEEHVLELYASRSGEPLEEVAASLEDFVYLEGLDLVIER